MTCKMFFQWGGMILSAGLLAGCSQDLSQNDVNKQQRAAAEASADAQKKADKVEYEARKAITDAEQQRRDKVGQATTEAQTNPDASVPKLDAKVAEANREAEKKITDARQEAADKERALNEKVRDKVEKANETTAAYQAQQLQKRYVDDHQRMLEEYDTNMTDVKKRRNDLAGEARDRFDLKLKAFDDKRSKAQKALNDLKGAKPLEWTTFRDESEQSFADLRAAYEQVTHRDA